MTGKSCIHHISVDSLLFYCISKTHYLTHNGLIFTLVAHVLYRRYEISQQDKLPSNMAKSRATQHIRQTTQSAVHNLYQFSTGIRNKKVTSDLNIELVQRFDCWSICEAPSPPPPPQTIRADYTLRFVSPICWPDIIGA